CARGTRSATAHERLDPFGIANERDHHRDAEREEQALQDVHAVPTEPEQVGERPTGRKRGTKYLGTDQDHSTDHRDDVDPDDLAALSARYIGHGSVPLRAAMSPKPAAGSRRQWVVNEPERCRDTGKIRARRSHRDYADRNNANWSSSVRLR